LRVEGDELARGRMKEQEGEVLGRWVEWRKRWLASGTDCGPRSFSKPLLCLHMVGTGLVRQVSRAALPIGAFPP
jgi:hypothetical protein